MRILRNPKLTVKMIRNHFKDKQKITQNRPPCLTSILTSRKQGIQLFSVLINILQCCAKKKKTLLIKRNLYLHFGLLNTFELHKHGNFR